LEVTAEPLQRATGTAGVRLRRERSLAGHARSAMAGKLSALVADRSGLRNGSAAALALRHPTAQSAAGFAFQNAGRERFRTDRAVFCRWFGHHETASGNRLRPWDPVVPDGHDPPLSEPGEGAYRSGRTEVQKFSAGGDHERASSFIRSAAPPPDRSRRRSRPGEAGGGCDTEHGEGAAKETASKVSRRPVWRWSPSWQRSHSACGRWRTGIRR
jgi:hypothetical protein